MYIYITFVFLSIFSLLALLCNLFLFLTSRVPVIGRQKLFESRKIVLYSINLDVFSIAIEFLTTNDLDSVELNK